jgi:cytochrome P450
MSATGAGKLPRDSDAAAPLVAPAAVLGSTEPLRPAPSGAKRRLIGAAMAALPGVLRLARALPFLPRIGTTYLVSRHDDVREVLGSDASFRVPYAKNLAVITGGEPFMLSMDDTAEYREQLSKLRRVVLATDLPRLGNEAETAAEARVAAAGGQVDVVDLVRQVSFEVIARYFGVPAPRHGRLDVWGTRLFEFQFVAGPGGAGLRAEVEVIAPAFREHIDAAIASRKADGAVVDDVLARCLQLQAEGVPGYSDREIRTALLCMVVGGPPQPPMVVPQALEQLLRRPGVLAAARGTAMAGDDDRLWRLVREAMRFDPLAPWLPRVLVEDAWIARGTRRGRQIPKGSTVLASIASAMHDGRRVPFPQSFDPKRREHEYMHFGGGLHECFGREINRATLHRMLKPLLRRPNVRRAPGKEGHLSKRGPFAERLVVAFG